MKKLLPFFLLFVLILILFSSFFWLYEAKFFIGRASVFPNSFSVDNSYLFITPLRAKANGKEKIRLTIYVLNNQGLGVMGKKVYLSTEENLLIEQIQALTDNFGKAIFDIASTKDGDYYLEVKVEDKPLKQKAHLSFY